MPLSNGCTCSDVRRLNPKMPDGWLCIACRAAADRLAAGVSTKTCDCGRQYTYQISTGDPGECRVCETGNIHSGY